MIPLSQFHPRHVPASQSTAAAGYHVRFMKGWQEHPLAFPHHKQLLLDLSPCTGGTDTLSDRCRKTCTLHCMRNLLLLLLLLGL